jgi:uncharacterized protein YeaO (DUF488 family)
MIRIVRLGSPRVAGEGVRLGTVRRPPRGVPKSEFAKRDWFDLWYPDLSPSPDAMKLGQEAESPAQWTAFAKMFRREMATPERVRTLALLAALSHDSNFSLGCYCADESRCHRSLLRELLAAAGAEIG